MLFSLSYKPNEDQTAGVYIAGVWQYVTISGQYDTIYDLLSTWSDNATISENVKIYIDSLGFVVFESDSTIKLSFSDGLNYVLGFTNELYEGASSYTSEAPATRVFATGGLPLLAEPEFNESFNLSAANIKLLSGHTNNEQLNQATFKDGTFHVQYLTGDQQHSQLISFLSGINDPNIYLNSEDWGYFYTQEDFDNHLNIGTFDSLPGGGASEMVFYFFNEQLDPDNYETSAEHHAAMLALLDGGYYMHPDVKEIQTMPKFGRLSTYWLAEWGFFKYD